MSAFRIIRRGAALLLSAAACGSSLAVTTHQNASSQIEVPGNPEVRDDATATDGFASSQALWPGPPTAYQARTAARSRAAEIAANSRIFDTGFNAKPFDLVLSQAIYAIEAAGALVPQRAAFDFFLPPAYLEIVSNAEVPFPHEVSFFADLRACFTTACSAGDSQFLLQAFMEGNFASHSEGFQATGNAALDLTPLRNPVLTDIIENNFIRTVLLEFPAFTGHIDVGLVPAGLPLTIEYVLQTRASGRVAFSSAIAAINDPFFLDTDPVIAGVPVALTLAPVPEPATLWMFAAAALLWPALRRRRHG